MAVNRLFLTFFGFLFSFSTMANTNTLWSNPRTDKQQYQTHAYPVTLDLLNKMRAVREGPGSTTAVQKHDYMVERVRTGGGNGSGIACFAHPDHIEAAMFIWSPYSGRVKPGGEKWMQWVIPLDATRAIRDKQNRIINRVLRTDLTPALSDENAMAYLNRVLTQRLARMNPAFLNALQDIIFNKLPPTKWIHRGSLPLFPDTGPNNTPEDTGSSLAEKISTRIDESTCQHSWPVSLVMRHQMLDMRQAIIEADYNLLAKMHDSRSPIQGTVSDALLILHEALYYMVMGKGVFHSTYIENIPGELLSTKPIDPKALATVANTLL